MDVIVYTTPTCPYCTQAKAFLAQQGVPFVEKNVAADRQAAMEMVRVSGQQGVPVITVNGEPVVGFDQPRLRQLLKKAKPRLGASVADAASLAKNRTGLPTSGAYVGKVRPGLPADKAGLRKGDVITALGGQPIILVDDLYQLASQVPQGRDVSLTYVRQGREHDTLIRL
jgi:glutaredoxin-like YruB-family protein